MSITSIKSLRIARQEKKRKGEEQRDPTRRMTALCSCTPKETKTDFITGPKVAQCRKMESRQEETGDAFEGNWIKNTGTERRDAICVLIYK